MARKTEQEMNKDAIDFAENYNKKVAPGPAKKAMAIGAIAVGTAAGALGLGAAGENDRQAEQMTNQNNEQIMDIVQTGGDVEIPTKGGDAGTYIDSEGRHIQKVVGQDGVETHIDVATGQAIAQVSSTSMESEQATMDPAAKETDNYAHSEEFAQGGGMPTNGG